MWKDTLANVLLLFALLYPALIFFLYWGVIHYDMAVWLETGKIVAEKGILSVYSVESKMPEFVGGYYNYPLPWLLIITIVYYFTKTLQFADFKFFYILKMVLLIFFESSIIILHNYLLKKVGNLNSSLAIFAFSVMPGMMNSFTPLIWGQMDSIPTFFTLLSLLFFEKKRYNSSAFSLGLAIATKYYPLIILPSYLIFIYKSKEGSNNAVYSKIARYFVIAVLPLLLVSVPPLIYDANAYIGANTFYKDWVGSLSIQRWIYSSLGIDPYLWYSSRANLTGKVTVLEYVTLIVSSTSGTSSENLKYVPIISYLSILIMCIVLFVSYFKILSAKKSTPVYVGSLLPLLALLGYWKFIQENFLVWVLPFVIIDLWTSKKTAPLIWLFFSFLLAVTWLSFIFGVGSPIFNYQGINIYFLIPLINIFYHLELLKRI